MRQKNLKIQLNQLLDNKLAIGVSKHQEKIANEGKSPFVHSVSSAHNYRGVLNNFSDWVRDNKQEVWKTKDLNQIDKSVAIAFLQYQKDRGLKPTSIGKDLAAINKVLNLGLTKKEAGIPKRSNYDTFKSRNGTNENLTDTLKEKNKEQMLFAKSCGCRRESILEVEAKDFILDKQGIPVAVNLIEKAGRHRVAPILLEYRQPLYEILLKSPENGPIFDYYSRQIDNHSFRSEYAINRYKELTERNELYGIEIKADYRKLDSDILRNVSNDLGHNRLDVAEECYINKRKR